MNRILMNKRNVESVKLHYDKITSKHCLSVNFVSGELYKLCFDTEEQAERIFNLFHDKMNYIEVYGD